MARVLDLRNVLELINDGLDNGSLAQQELVIQEHQAVFHILAQLGDQVHIEQVPQLLHQGLGDIAPIAKQFAPQALGQERHWLPVIHIAWGEVTGQQFALIVDNQVQLEAIKPAHGSLAPGGQASKHLVGRNAAVMTNGQRSGIDERNAATGAIQTVQICQ